MRARLVLACRDLTKGEAVAVELRALGSPDVAVKALDAASAPSIAALARSCAADCPRIDVLVNNAGVANGDRHVTRDGFELTFATNVLGYHRLSLAMLEQLRAS